MLWLIACGPDEPAPVAAGETDPATVASAVEERFDPAPPDLAALSASGEPDTRDTGERIVPDETFDVVVVGSGPAGMSAALAAREAGASVLVLERDDEAGLGLTLGGLAFAVGTRWQQATAVFDSPEDAMADWESITGVPGTTGGVQTFLEESAATLDWLIGYGLDVSSLMSERDVGWVPRTHALDWGTYEVHPLITAFDGTLRTQVEVTDPYVVDGVVSGVKWTDLATGETGVTGARAVVIATGGFLRDAERAREANPRLADRDLVFEQNPQSDGGSRPFLDAVGAAWTSEENMAVYVHSIPDPDFPDDGLLVIGTENGILVGQDGRRFAGEEILRSMDLFDELPDGDVFAVVTEVQAEAFVFSRPGYNWADVTEPEIVDAASIWARSPDLFSADSLEELADLVGIDAAGLTEEVAALNDAIAAGGGDAWGRDVSGLGAFESDTWYAVRLVPGLAKNFGGVATDTSGSVLDGDGDPIPGLYAAGEVAGMILGGGAGEGFSGSVGACYQGGRAAGTSAAAWAATLANAGL